MLYRLGANPDVQQKLYEEVMQVVGAEFDVTDEHLPLLKYVELVVKETERLHPSVPVIAREVTHPIEIGNSALQNQKSIANFY